MSEEYLTTAMRSRIGGTDEITDPALNYEVSPPTEWDVRADLEGIASADTPDIFTQLPEAAPQETADDKMERTLGLDEEYLADIDGYGQDFSFLGSKPDTAVSIAKGQIEPVDLKDTRGFLHRGAMKTWGGYIGDAVAPIMSSLAEMDIISRETEFRGMDNINVHLEKIGHRDLEEYYREFGKNDFAGWLEFHTARGVGQMLPTIVATLLGAPGGPHVTRAVQLGTIFMRTYGRNVEELRRENIERNVSHEEITGTAFVSSVLESVIEIAVGPEAVMRHLAVQGAKGVTRTAIGSLGKRTLKQWGTEIIRKGIRWSLHGVGEGMEEIPQAYTQELAAKTLNPHHEMRSFEDIMRTEFAAAIPAGLLFGGIDVFADSQKTNMRENAVKLAERIDMDRMLSKMGTEDRLEYQAVLNDLRKKLSRLPNVGTEGADAAIDVIARISTALGSMGGMKAVSIIEGLQVAIAKGDLSVEEFDRFAKLSDEQKQVWLREKGITDIVEKSIDDRIDEEREQLFEQFEEGQIELDLQLGRESVQDAYNQIEQGRRAEAEALRGEVEEVERAATIEEASDKGRIEAQLTLEAEALARNGYSRPEMAALSQEEVAVLTAQAERVQPTAYKSPTSLSTIAVDNQTEVDINTVESEQTLDSIVQNRDAEVQRLDGVIAQIMEDMPEDQRELAQTIRRKMDVERDARLARDRMVEVQQVEEVEPETPDRAAVRELLEQAGQFLSTSDREALFLAAEEATRAREAAPLILVPEQTVSHAANIDLPLQPGEITLPETDIPMRPNTWVPASALPADWFRYMYVEQGIQNANRGDYYNPITGEFLLPSTLTDVARTVKPEVLKVTLASGSDVDVEVQRQRRKFQLLRRMADTAIKRQFMEEAEDILLKHSRDGILPQKKALSVKQQIDRGAEEITVYHFAFDEIGVVDPRFHKDAAKGKETARRSAWPDQYIMRSYYGGPQYQREVMIGPIRHEAKIKTSKLYDFMGDQDALAPLSTDMTRDILDGAWDVNLAITIYEGLIKKAGYLGAYNLSEGSDTVMLFRKQRVKASVQADVFAQARSVPVSLQVSTETRVGESLKTIGAWHDTATFDELRAYDRHFHRTISDEDGNDVLA